LRLRVTTSAALRRHRSTLMGLRGPSRTPAHRSRVDIGSTRPVRRSSPRGCSIKRASPQPKLWVALLGLPFPFRVHHRDPVPSRRLPSRSDDTSSHDLSLPYDTVSDQQLRLMIADPSTTTSHVRGLDTPFATFTASPPDACASERPWASPFKDFPSLRSASLSGALPSCRYPMLRASPKGSTHKPAGFRALIP
jgi:hypothetical protein